MFFSGLGISFYHRRAVCVQSAVKRYIRDDGFHGDSRGAGGNVHPGVSYSERNYCAQAVYGDCHYYAWIVFVFFLSAGKRAGALISSRR